MWEIQTVNFLNAAVQILWYNNVVKSTWLFESNGLKIGIWLQG